ncbi:uncharacterized protein EI90DRAFT_3072079, partial [Cantharellus anzutake]|uniref:uncharacterized protein n=1 Tax=Cantharellus anzutake TaxID=1750568 RepID=UPI001904D8AD
MIIALGLFNVQGLSGRYELKGKFSYSHESAWVPLHEHHHARGVSVMIINVKTVLDWQGNQPNPFHGKS